MDRKIRRVVCAAIRAEDGCILLGIRHYGHDMHVALKYRTDHEKFYHRYGADQGFVDQYGVYMTRSEAYNVAKAAGQIVDESACVAGRLFSEALY